MFTLFHKIKRFALNKGLFWGIISAVLLYPVSVGAITGNTGSGGSGGSLQNPIGSNSFSELISGIASAAAKIGIPIAAIFIIYSGLKFVMARGNETELTKAKEMFKWAIIGTAVLLGAWVIAGAVGSTICSVGGGHWVNGRCVSLPTID